MKTQEYIITSTCLTAGGYFDKTTLCIFAHDEKRCEFVQDHAMFNWSAKEFNTIEDAMKFCKMRYGKDLKFDLCITTDVPSDCIDWGPYISVRHVEDAESFEIARIEII